MSYIGDFALGSTFDTKFTTRQISGAPSTLSSSPVISAYVDNSTTQLTAGITLSVDFDSVTGLNNVRVVASGGNGYAAGSNYQLVITTGTVNSVSVVGEVVAEFSIEARSALRPTTAARTLDVSSTGEAGVDWANVGSPTTSVNLSGTSTLALEPTTAGRKLDVTATGEAGIDWANIGAATTTVSLSGTTVKAVTDAVALPSSATIAITGNITGNVSGSVGSVTGAVGSVTGAVGSVTGNVGGNVTGSVGSVVGNVGGNVVGSVGSVTASVTAGTVSDKTGYTLSATGSAALTEGYRTNGATGTLNQILYEILAHLGESSITSTTKTLKKIDHSTSAATLTLDSSTTPTSITRAS